MVPRFGDSVWQESVRKDAAIAALASWLGLESVERRDG
jgi:hypothetical protein